MLQVLGMFASIQGESSHAGRPCAFVRLAGCDVGCRWCDTRRAWPPGGGQALSLDQAEAAAVALLERLGPGALAEITGGEPLLQPEAPALAQRLARRWTTLVETSGTRDITPLRPPVRRIVDVKCPGSGAAHKMDWANLGRLRPGDEIKFVLSGPEDVDFAYGVIKKHGLDGQAVPILFSPAWGMLDPALLARWMLGRPAVARLQLPLHKIIWPGGEPEGDGPDPTAGR